MRGCIIHSLSIASQMPQIWPPDLLAVASTWSHKIFLVRIYKEPRPQRIPKEMRRREILFACLAPISFISLAKVNTTGS